MAPFGEPMECTWFSTEAVSFLRVVVNAPSLTLSGHLL